MALPPGPPGQRVSVREMRLEVEIRWGITPDASRRGIIETGVAAVAIIAAPFRADKWRQDRYREARPANKKSAGLPLREGQRPFRSVAASTS